MKKQLLEDFFERHNFSVCRSEEVLFAKDDSTIHWSIHTCTNTGENLTETIDCKNTVKAIRLALFDLYDTFDIEDYVAMWLNAKQNGVKDVPDVETLTEDARAIKEMLKDLSIDFNCEFAKEHY